MKPSRCFFTGTTW